jgi:hypothetical protein
MITKFSSDMESDGFNPSVILARGARFGGRPYVAGSRDARALP